MNTGIWSMSKILTKNIFMYIMHRNFNCSFKMNFSYVSSADILQDVYNIWFNACTRWSLIG